MPAINLQDLPVELKLQILSNLPAKEIQKVRQTSKHLRDIIDLQENQNALTQPATTKALKAVQKLHSAIFNFDPDKTDLLSLLTQLHRIRGRSETEHDLVLRLFLRCHTAVAWIMFDYIDLCALLTLLCELHDYHHGWDGFPPLTWTLDRNRSEKCGSKAGWLSWNIDDHGNSYLEKFGITRNSLAEYYDRIVDGQELTFDKVDRPSTEFYQSFDRVRDVTTYNGIEKPVTLFQAYHFLDERLYEILGVPPIPDDVAASPFDPKTDILHYGVKSLWAYGWVMQLLGDLQAGMDRKINAIELAAVRQEVFLW